MTVSLIPAGAEPATLTPGDLLFVDRPGFIPGMIKLGQRIRPDLRPWADFAHVVCVYDDRGLAVEALTGGVCWAHTDKYLHVPYVHVATGLDEHDQVQAQDYLRRHVGDRYGFEVDAGIAMRYLTPGRGLWFGLCGTEVCSGLAAQMLTRGDWDFQVNPASMGPAELARAVSVPPNWKDLLL